MRKLRLQSFAARFAKLYTPVPESGCWIWLGAMRPGGYGGVVVGGKIKMAHRASWELEHGPIPAGRIVCHRCDVRLCVNPAHLFLGTHQTNSDDKIAKGRDRGFRSRIPTRGSKHHMAVLDETDVRFIRDHNEIRAAELASRYGVSQATICMIRKRKSWRHI